MSQMLMAQPSTIEDQTSSAMEVEPTNAEPKPVAAPAVDTKTMTQEDHAKKKLDGIEAIQIPKMAQIESIRIPESVNVSQHVEEKVKPEVLMAGNESTQDDSDNSDDAISIPEINIDDSDEDE